MQFTSYCVLSICINFILILRVSCRGIGPQCPANRWVPNRNCTLPSGKIGVCARICDVPQNRKQAKLCCHLKDPNYLRIYYCCESESSGDVLAVGGVKTEPDEFPYMVALGWYVEGDKFTWDNMYKFKCGGVLISPKFVTTAAHCAYVDGFEPNVVVPGGVNLAEQHIGPYTIERVFEHSNYDDDLAYNDIALVKLVGNYPGTTINVWNRPNIVNTSFTAIGYGDTTFGGTSSDDLLKVFLNQVSQRNCQQYYENDDTLPSGIIDTQLCAQDFKNIMDTCQGDSGGPLIMNLYNNRRQKIEFLVGITSFGKGCAMKSPGVYTRVSSYIEWMKRIVNSNRN